jgi:dihydrofolate synthase/folylpolyglutamate synthase
MTYLQTINFLYGKLPMFTRVGAAAIKKDLHNTVAMCSVLGNPQNQFKSIHVAGTNGKGSTSHMLAAILQQAGYKTGLYTSPHLKDFRERIRINGKMIPKSFVTNFVKNQQQIIESIEPSFFEVTVALAFDYFAKEKVDFVIVEVGLGGRLDSTNIITPELSIITNISLDHTQLLGDTLSKIAFEKAGIIKPKVPVVIGEKHIETTPVFIQKASVEHAPISFAEEELTIITKEQKEFLVVDVFSAGQLRYPSLKLDLTGSYQRKNILTVIQSVLLLKKMGLQISDQVIYTALKNVKKLTGLQGRWQTIGKNPLIICDTGHNIAGITEVLQNIASVPHQNLHMVIGMVKDKDIDGVLAILPKDASYYFCEPRLERALPAKELQLKGQALGLFGGIFQSVVEAAQNAKRKAGTEDLIFIGGSTFVVAEIL